MLKERRPRCLFGKYPRFSENKRAKYRIMFLKPWFPYRIPYSGMAFQYTMLPQLDLLKSSLTYVPYFPCPIDHQNCQFSFRNALWLKSLFIILMATALGLIIFSWSINKVSYLISLTSIFLPSSPFLTRTPRIIFLNTIPSSYFSP